MNILLATDGSEYSDSALDFMLRFPFPPGSTMTVLSVVDDIPMLPAELDALDETQNEALKAANKRLKEEAQELVDRESARLREDGWPGETLVRTGKPVDQILRVAEEISADLVVLGSHGKSRAQRFMLGSVSDRVLEYAPCSVVIVKKKPGDGVPAAIEPGTNTAYRIMLAYDISDVAREALQVCASFPLEANSKICVVNVMPLITAYRQDVRQHISSIWMQKKIIMQAELDKAVKSLPWATAELTTQLREAANVSEEILTAAEEAESDLIMVGCKDKSAIQRFLLGSITQRMARYAECTVWAVRKKHSGLTP
ncbi:MAG: universal stress protein [Gammaproteobacteria bacterium]